jgi:hypothetical protein
MGENGLGLHLGWQIEQLQGGLYVDIFWWRGVDMVVSVYLRGD